MNSTSLLNMDLNSALPWVVGIGLVTLRCGGMFLMVPTLGGEAIPTRMRTSFAVIVSCVIGSFLGPLSLRNPLQLILAASGELLMGVAMGLVLRMVLASSEIAGELIGLSMGLTFMEIVDPLTRESSNIPGQIMGIMVVLMLLATEGHHTMISGLVVSFREAPVGTVFPRAEYLNTILPLLSTIIATGLRIAAPLVFSLLLANFALGLLSRVAPQFQLFAISFGITIGVGLFMLQTSITPSLSLILQSIRQFPDYLSMLVGG